MIQWVGTATVNADLSCSNLDVYTFFPFFLSPNNFFKEVLDPWCKLSTFLKKFWVHGVSFLRLYGFKKRPPSLVASADLQ